MGSYTKRQKLWDREALNSYLCEQGRHPICNLCGLPVTPGQDWDESHGPTAKAFGGKRTQIAHRRCNREDGLEVKRRADKSNRVRAKHTKSWRSDRPVPGGKRAPWKRTLDGRVIDRRTGEPWGSAR